MRTARRKSKQAGKIKEASIKVTGNSQVESLSQINTPDFQIAKDMMALLIMNQSTKEVTQNELGQPVTTFKFEGD